MMEKMLQELKGYNLVGDHSAVKTCLWLKRSVRDEGICYKQKFYGIQSHRCLQMTPALVCNMNCIHCWRPLKLLPQLKEWDNPEFIAEESIKAQQKLLSGFYGTEKVNRKKLDEAYQPNQVAISLIGEPGLYPRLDELIESYKSRGMTTFVVTNGSRPDVVEKIEPYQLYISLTAFDEESHMELNRPGKSLWDKINQSLEAMANKGSRTVLRLTLMKGVNMEPQKFAPLIEKASPTFVEAKAYMHLGHSRERLDRSNMPDHADVMQFAEELSTITDYKVQNESEISRVVMLRC
ncbi:MAG: 4-demethylwyosine synthase TYW1 [Archaeoglobaceae archaeon]